MVRKYISRTERDERYMHVTALHFVSMEQSFDELVKFAEVVGEDMYGRPLINGAIKNAVFPVPPGAYVVKDQEGSVYIWYPNEFKTNYKEVRV